MNRLRRLPPPEDVSPPPDPRGRRISPGEWRIFSLAFALVIVVRASLWLLPSRLIMELVQRLNAAAPRGTGGGTVEPLCVWAVEAAAARVPRASCLTQAVAARMLLLLNGLDPELCVGVARDQGGGFRAHAWLEREGRIILGGRESMTFTRLPAFGLGGFVAAQKDRP